MLIKLLTIIIAQSMNLAPSTLCCHMHDDGFLGCWPLESSNIECESTIHCPYGSHQANADDTESWVCNAPPRPNS